jgi:predicted transcriptional regulator
MNRNDAINRLGGIKAAAEWLGMTPHAVSNWAVDDEGNLTSRRVCDAILAALVRQHIAQRVKAGVPVDPDEFALAELP